ncbi:ABC transporter permease [Luteococcus peritonei]|uniref:ABC transporter permease n=1 Tax=Luteococcus peritonei TaxID=88874 RepID=A0ABW4RVD6_9ACTN
MSSLTLPAAPVVTPAPTTREEILAGRPRPAWGGLNRTLLGLEVRRLLRNRRSLFVTIALPTLMYLMITQGLDASEKVGRGTVGGLLMVSMGLWGAGACTATVGAAVGLERAVGWSRQLRLTPLSPVAYVVAKTLAGMAGGLAGVLAVTGCGIARHDGTPLQVILPAMLVVWLGAAVFAAFGLFVGYLMPTDNAMQLVSLGMTAFCFLGGLFTPMSDDSFWGHVARFTPMWGLRRLAMSPFGDGQFTWLAVANVAAWFVIFVGGAAWLMARDTDRV